MPKRLRAPSLAELSLFLSGQHRGQHGAGRSHGIRSFYNRPHGSVQRLLKPQPASSRQVDGVRLHDEPTPMRCPRTFRSAPIS